MAVKEEIEVEGEVVEALPSTMFRTCKWTTVELSAYLCRGRITYRYR
ncbi:MAG: hypothetical protein ACM3QU_02745 [Verrucomicrobiota bacterium]